MNAPIEFARAVCPHDCPDTCAMRVTVENGRAVKVTGDPDHPPTQGVLCTKVSRYAERVHHPRRLTTPMRRVGAKGEGRFEPIGWDEALQLAATRLTEIAARAPEAIVPYSYAGTMGLVQGDSIAQRFFHKGDRRIGFYTLMMASGRNWKPSQVFNTGNGSKMRMQPTKDHPNSPLAKYIAQQVAAHHRGKWDKLTAFEARFYLTSMHYDLGTNITQV